MYRENCGPIVILTGILLTGAFAYRLSNTATPAQRTLPASAAAWLPTVAIGSAFIHRVDAIPLTVGAGSHLVVMEYEAWFGPQAVTFAGAAAQPLLQSADMQSFGAGYDSVDPTVIWQHVAWMEHMGIDAVLVDLSNDAACTFDSESYIGANVPNCTPAFRKQVRTIRNNTGALYPAWTSLGVTPAIIPLLDGVDANVLGQDSDGKTAFEKEVEYFGNLMQEYPNLQVIYEGKPLMVVYLGSFQEPDKAHDPLWHQIQQFAASHPSLSQKYTFKYMAGHLESQPWLWANRSQPTGPIEISSTYGFWSWVDRMNAACTSPQCPYFPTYSVVGGRVENLTVSIATPGHTGWGCPQPIYCEDTSLRFNGNKSYATFSSFMSQASALAPVFLFIHQFNEFVADEGWNADTDDDIEPSNLWGSTALNEVQQQVAAYKAKLR